MAPRIREAASVRNLAAHRPLAIGLVLAVMVYATGHVSGGHLNPAVTLGVYVRGKATAADLIGYRVVRTLAGVIAALGVV